MADQLPNFIVIRLIRNSRFLSFVKDDAARRGYLRCNEESVFSPLAKIEVEPAESDSRYVHLRFVHTNKYWGRPVTDRFLIASHDQPEEDRSKPTCTLIHPTVRNGQLSLLHVPTNRGVEVELSTNFLFAQSQITAQFLFTFVDWDTLVGLPTHVAFKGHNDRYVKAITFQNLPYLQLSSNDPNEEESNYEVQLMPDGNVRIKSVSFNRYWSLSPAWIWADNNQTTAATVGTLFWPVKIEDKTIALRNAGNNRFIKPLSADRKVDCLNAQFANITLEARFEVEELVLERDIYNVRYRMEDARIYDEKPFLAGIATATNLTNEDSDLAVTVAFEDSYSFSFTNSLSITTGVTTRIRVGIPLIKSGKFEFSTEINNTFEWNRTTTETKSVTAEHKVTVPAKSRARLSYVGTQGKCSVPFNYTRRDKRSVNGQMSTTQHVDGIYNGVNYYNFQFEALETEAL